MKIIHSFGRLFLAGIVLCGAVRADVTGTILGVVRDQTGGVVPNVEVKATHVATNQSRTATTNAGGEYSILALPVGR